MGMGGLFIRTKEPVAVGTMIRLLVDLPSGEVRGRAIVRSVKAGEGMGVGIVSMNPEDRSRLNHFLGKLPA
jgi:PilZ domain-containing protein